MNQNNDLNEAMTEYRGGHIGRREFLRRVGMIGLSSLAAGTLLSSVGRSYAQGVAKGGTFIEGYDRNFSPLDPIRTPWADPGMNAVYEPLVTHDLEGKLVPFLALAYDEGEAAWRFDLPTGRTFQSGTALTAEMVAKALALIVNPETGQIGSFYSQVSGVAPDGNAVVVNLKSPKHGLGEVLATEYSYIANVDKRAELGAGTYGAQEADGTGPFRLAEYKTGSKVRVEKWAEYPGQGAPFFENKGAAHLDAVEWVPILEPAQRAAEIESGTVHAMKAPPAADVARLKANPDLVVLEFPEPSNFFLLPSMKRTDLGFDDVRVRQALSHAIDREGIVAAILGGGGNATFGPVSSGWVNYEPRVEEFNAYDVDASAKLFEEAGWTLGSDGVREKNGVRLSFTGINLTDPVENQVMAAIAGMFAEVGAEMKVESLEGAAFRERRPTADIHGFKWLWSVPTDIVGLFVRLFQPADNADAVAVLQAYAKWENAKTPEEVTAVTSAAQMLHAEKLPTLPIYTPTTVWVHHKKVHGWRPNSYSLYPFYNDVWIEQ